MPTYLDLEAVPDWGRIDLHFATIESMARKRNMTVVEYASLCPPLAKVFCVAMATGTDALPLVLFDDTDDSGAADVTRRWLPCGSERELLHRVGLCLSGEQKDVWASPLVTYNGRGYDLPVLAHRMSALGVTTGLNTVRTLLAEYRFSKVKQHVDLQEEFTGYGASGRWPLAAYAIGYGVGNPKEHCDGGSVAERVVAGMVADVLAYCAQDVLALRALHRRWQLG